MPRRFSNFIILVCLLMITVMSSLFGQVNLQEFEQLLQKARDLRYENFDSAAYYSQKAEAVALFQKNDKLLLKVRGQQGGIHYIAGKYDRSLEYYREAYELAQQLGSQEDLANAVNGRGLIAISQHDYVSAVQLFRQALSINEELENQESIVRNLFNLGISLSELRDYDQAILHLERAAEIAKSIADDQHLSMIYNRLGRIHYELGNDAVSRRYYEQLLYGMSVLSNWEKTFMYVGLAELDYREGQYAAAVQHAERALTIASKMGAYWDMERASKALSQAYEAIGNFPLALEFARKNRVYQDSLYSREKSQEINFLKLQLAESDNERLVNEKEFIEQKARFTQYFLIGLFVLLVLLLGLLYSYRRNLKLKIAFGQKLETVNRELQEQKEFTAKQNEELREMDLAKNKLFSILSHDLKSPIQTLKQFLELNSQEMMDPEDLKKGLPLLYLQMVKTERMMENLLHWSKSQMGGIQPKPEDISLSDVMKEVLNNFEHPCRIKGLKVDFSQDVHVDKISFDRVQLMLVLQNVFNNAIKYSPRGGEVRIFFSKNKGFLRLHIRDYGPGLAEKRRLELESAHNFVDSSLGSDKEVGSGLGLLLVKQFVEMNHGQVLIKSKEGEGTEVILEFPVTDQDPDELLLRKPLPKSKVS